MYTYSILVTELDFIELSADLSPGPGRRWSCPLRCPRPRWPCWCWTRRSSPAPAPGF